MAAVKVLISDDEVWDIEALETMIHRCFPNVLVLPSVYDGIEMVETVEREKPDIVIVDINMPGMDGLEALELLRSKNIRMEIIIHTAYSRFDYIRKAMKMGACDFLVKPVFEENFVETFSRVLNGVEEKKKLHGRQLGLGTEAVSAVLENNVMMSLLLHKPDEEGWRLLYENREGCGVIAAFQISRCKEQDAVYVALISEIRRHCACLSILHQTTCYCYLILDSQTGGEWAKEWISHWLPETIHSLGKKYEVEMRAGISEFRNHFSQMAGAVEEADIALQNETDKEISFYKGKKPKLAENIFFCRAKEMSHLIQEGKTDEALREIRKLLCEHGKDTEVEFATCFYGEELLTNVALLLDMDKRRTGMKWTLQERVKHMIQENVWHGCKKEEEFSGISAQSSIFQKVFLAYMEKELLELLEDLERPVRKDNLYIEKSLLYLEQNYMQDDLSLGQTADAIGITQFYLSRLFKQERNQTFLEILTDIRISRAMRLLMDPSRTVQNVSTMVGYNVKYFYQAFKSGTGISIKEFREGLFGGTLPNSI